jgi:hypothetical protein
MQVFYIKVELLYLYLFGIIKNYQNLICLWIYIFYTILLLADLLEYLQDYSNWWRFNNCTHINLHFTAQGIPEAALHIFVLAPSATIIVTLLVP